jgi:hypothetical protein
LKGRCALLALQQKLDAAEAALDLTNARDYTHRVQNVGGRLLGVVALSDRKYKTVTFERRLDRAER